MLGRPHRAAPLTASLLASTPPGSWRLLFICSPDDPDTTDACHATGHPVLVVDWRGGKPGDYARKINAGAAATSEPLLFLGADDLAFHPRWLERACAQLRPGVGVVGTNDLGNARVVAGEHSTHSLVTRIYVETFGTIDEVGKVLHEGYWHEFVDDELVGTARARDAFAFAGDSIVEHLHPSWGKAPTDRLYAKQRRRMDHGRRLYRRRQPLWTAPSS